MKKGAEKMKRKAAFIMALALCAAPMTAFADENGGTSPTDIDVKAKYIEGASSGTVILADVTWDDMTFTYTGGEKTWNGKEHKYESAEGAWADESKTITVTNHSNAGITAELTFSAEIEGVDGSFDKSSFTLDTAEGTAVENAPSGSAEFSLSGAGVSSDEKVGTISVNIAKIPEPASVTNATELKDALKNGGRVKLEDDIKVNYSSFDDMYIDLNGHTLTGNISCYEGASCTIKNGTINNKLGAVYSSGTLELIDCTLSSERSTVLCVARGTANIRNCKLLGGGTWHAISNKGGVINIYDSLDIELDIVNENSKAQTAINAGRYNFDPTEFVDANDFTVTQNGADWIVNNNRR